jgi:DNA-binding winged helix-turn-helix (wHTH) protein/DNA-binding CsgD family transcriptional regulator
VVLLFDDFSLDPRRCELRRGGNLIAVEPQVFDVIVYLIENRDRVVSRDDLIAAVWKGRIVSESTLASRINTARQALADSGEAQRLIRTIPRKGFRFVGEVVEADAAPDTRARPGGRGYPQQGISAQPPDRGSETELSALIGDIYDAALDPSLWSNVLARTSKYAGAAAASLASWGLTSKVAKIQYTFGITQEAERAYEETYSKLDPRHTGIFFFGVGEVVSSSDIVPYEEMLESRLVKEYAAPLGWIDLATALLEKSATALTALNLLRGEQHGRVDDAMLHRVRLLVPHFRRAVLIGRTIELKRVEVDSLADTLDMLADGLFLVDPAGRLMHANARGHAILAEEGILRAAGGRLVASDPDAQQALRGAFSAAEGGDDVLGTQAIAVPLLADGQRHVAHVLPLTSGARRKAGASHAAAAAVFVRKAEADTPAAPEVIAKRYALTPSELRTLLTVVESGGVPNIGEALGIPEARANTHLRRVFEKTRTHEQAELVKLVASFAAPGR